MPKHALYAQQGLRADPSSLLAALEQRLPSERSPRKGLSVLHPPKTRQAERSVDALRPVVQQMIEDPVSNCAR